MPPRPGGIIVRVEDTRGIRRRSDLESLQRVEIILHDARVELVGAEPLDHGVEIDSRIAQGEEPRREILPGPFVVPPDQAGHRFVEGVADHRLPFVFQRARLERTGISETMRDMVGGGYEGFAAKWAFAEVKNEQGVA